MSSMIEDSATQGGALGRLATLVAERSKLGTLRVAIDGIDAAGKTTLADELAELLERDDVPVQRASIDSFHYPSSMRHLRSKQQPARSYYEDSFDYRALRRVLLDPLAPGGDHVVRTRIFDFRTDRPVHEAPTPVRPGTVLLFDGVFLLRPELEECWDLSMFIEVDPSTSLQRALKRDGELLGTAEAIELRYRQRYLPGQELYLSRVHPDRRADVLIENNDPTAPTLLRIPSA